MPLLEASRVCPEKKTDERRRPPSKARLFDWCGKYNLSSNSLVTDPCGSLKGKEPDEERRPPPRQSLLKQGLHPHPGPPRGGTSDGDEETCLDPDTFLFLGADPTEYGMSERNGQGPPNFTVADLGSTIRDSDSSEEELIEDLDDNRPPLARSIRSDDDDDEPAKL